MCRNFCNWYSQKLTEVKLQGKRNGKKQQTIKEDVEYYYQKHLKIKRDWTQILFSISGGDVVKYKELMQMNVFSFWNFYGVWIEDLKAKNSKSK